MRVNANAVLRSWTLLAAFGGSYAPAISYCTSSPLQTHYLFCHEVLSTYVDNFDTYANFKEVI